MSAVRVVLPGHLRTLSGVGGEVRIQTADSRPTINSVLDVLEAEYPMLRGTIRDHGTRQRRAYLRYFVCGQDVSHESPDSPLPDAVVSGKEVLRVVGAIAGG